MNDESRPKGAAHETTGKVSGITLDAGTDNARDMALATVVSPQRVQFRRGVKGWRLPEGGKLVTRSSRWGNPFDFRDYGGGREGRAEAVRLHRAWLLAQSALVLQVIRELAGRTLACYCPLDEPCHADTLLEVANGGAR